MNAKEYNRINELLNEYSMAAALLESVEARIKTRQLAAADELLPQHAEIKIKISKLEAELKQLADAHEAELFPEDKKRSHKTPFGDLQYRKSSSLEFEDEEKVILKIKNACLKEEQRASDAGRLPAYRTEQLIRTHEAPNLEALEKFDDVMLALFGIVRVNKDNFKITPFTMRSDKPAKASKQKEAA